MSIAFGYRTFGGPEVQELLDRPAPAPGPEEVAVEVAVAGVNPIDHMLRSGAIGSLNGDLPFPQVLGLEAAGVVTALGAEVEGLAVGDRVLGFALTGAGTYARHTVLLAAATARTPDGLSDRWAATVPVAGTTALDVMDQLDLPAGSRLLVTGVGGGVGLGVAQLARARGLTVIGTAGATKHALVAATGATPVDHRSADVTEQLRAHAPDGYDGVVDTVGGAALRAVAPLSVAPSAILSVGDTTVPELGGALVERHPDRATLERTADLMVRGVLDPHITSAHTLADAAAALARVEGGHATGKTVIDLRLEAG